MIWVSDKYAASRAWAKLRALDTAAADRAQLIAAGVAIHRIDSLYPEVGFASLEPRLIEYLASVPVSQLSAASGLNSLRDHFSAELPPGHDFPTDEFSPWIGSNETADGPLGAYLSNRIEAESLSGFLTYSNAMAHAVNLARSIYWAWWGMSKRASLPFASRRRADKLMCGVARIIQLDHEPLAEKKVERDDSA